MRSMSNRLRRLTLVTTVGVGTILGAAGVAAAATAPSNGPTATPHYITSCNSFVHRTYPSRNSAYCYGGDGATFRAWINCHMDDGSYQTHDGPWELASDNTSSVAQCGENGVWSSDGIDKHP